MESSSPEIDQSTKPTTTTTTTETKPTAIARLFRRGKRIVGPDFANDKQEPAIDKHSQSKLFRKDNKVELTQSQEPQSLEDPADIFSDVISLFRGFAVHHGVDSDGYFSYVRPVVHPLPVIIMPDDGVIRSRPKPAPTPPPAQLRLTLADLRQEPAHWRLFAHFVWNAAIILAERMDEQPQVYSVKGKSVLELGAGAGIPGLIASLNGASATILTDYPDPSFIVNLQDNVDRNLPIELRRTTRVLPFCWGEDSTTVKMVLDSLLRHNGNARSNDAPSDPTNSTKLFDVILMADVLWLPNLHRSLLESCQQLIKPSEGRIYLAFGQHTGAHVTDAFLALAQGVEFGFRARCLEVYKFPTEWGGPEVVLDEYNERKRTVYLYELMLP